MRPAMFDVHSTQVGRTLRACVIAIGVATLVAHATAARAAERSKSAPATTTATATATTPASSRSTVTATAGARTTIIRPITIAPVAELNFGSLLYSGNGQAGSVVLPARPPSTRVAVRVTLFEKSDATPLIRALVGEPGRVYRIGVPAVVYTKPGGLTANTFTLWSTTRGDITGTRLGAFDLKGNDTLRLGATLVVPKGTKKETYAAVVPVTISYE